MESVSRRNIPVAAFLEPAHLLQLLLREHALHAPDVDDEGEGVYGGLDDGGVECSGLIDHTKYS